VCAYVVRGVQLHGSNAEYDVCSAMTFYIIGYQLSNLACGKRQVLRYRATTPTQFLFLRHCSPLTFFGAKFWQFCLLVIFRFHETGIS